MIFAGTFFSVPAVPASAPNASSRRFRKVFDFNENSISTPTSPAGEETVALTQRIFAEPDAWLRRSLHMEARPQQTKMALAAARAFAESSALLVEAGTGVGKSLAYLLPGLIFSLLSEKKFVVSTHTIPLQEQILKKDVRICRELFERVPELRRFRNFSVVLMVGKANYLCGTRLAQALHRHEGLFDGNDGSDEARQLAQIAEWAAQPDCSGLREHLPFRVSDDVWESVNADSAACSRKHCSPKNCAYRRARAAVDRANLVVVNHSLLFALIGAGATPHDDECGVLYPNDFVVIDEAHRVPNVATDFFGSETSSVAVSRLLSKIEKATKKGGVLFETTRGNAGRGSAAASKFPGTARRAGTAGGREILSLVAEARAACEEFFGGVRFTFLEKNQNFRFREPDWAQNVCELPLGHLESKLKQLAQLETDEAMKGEITDFAARVAAFRLHIRECLELRDAPQKAYWAHASTGKLRAVTLCGKPIDVAQQLAETVFSKQTAVVLSSATLTDGKSMDRFKRRCGAEIAENSDSNGNDERDENAAPTRSNDDFSTDSTEIPRGKINISDGGDGNGFRDDDGTEEIPDEDGVPDEASDFSFEAITDDEDDDADDGDDGNADDDDFSGTTVPRTAPKHVPVRTLIENSPFDYEANMEIFLAKGFPEPDRRNAGALDVSSLCEISAHAVATVPDGGTLILCTSFEICRAVADALRLRFAGTREILEQDPKAGMPRRELIRRFIARGNAVLVGNASFWTGIDVPGTALSQLIITRLPFSNPREPMVEARGERIAERGGRPFFEMLLPDAVLQFRQGVGRLIRKADDRGRLLVLDSRMLSKSYGKRFIAALPHANYKILSPENFREILTLYPTKK